MRIRVASLPLKQVTKFLTLVSSRKSYRRSTNIIVVACGILQPNYAPTLITNVHNMKKEIHVYTFNTSERKHPKHQTSHSEPQKLNKQPVPGGQHSRSTLGSAVLGSGPGCMRRYFWRRCSRQESCAGRPELCGSGGSHCGRQTWRISEHPVWM